MVTFIVIVSKIYILFFHLKITDKIFSLVYYLLINLVILEKDFPLLYKSYIFGKLMSEPNWTYLTESLNMIVSQWLSPWLICTNFYLLKTI